MSDATATEVDALRAALESRDAQLSRQNAGLVQMARERDALRADVARLQAELDALRAIIESGAAQAQHPGRDLDAEVVAGVQAGRDDLRGLAGKAST